MTQTPREIVRRALKFEYPERMPRQTWALPWAYNNYPEVMEWLGKNYPDDITHAPGDYRPSPRVVGDPCEVGTYIDEWGCTFTNVQRGIIGEVKQPLIKEIEDWEQLEPPYETLPTDFAAARATANAFCAGTDRFVHASCCPRPWERYQFIRGTANAMMDLAAEPELAMKLLQRIHDFHMRELEFWVTTDVDAIAFMDDWGSQRQLLIAPPMWRKFFKEFYREYSDIAHRHGKFIFMHSDGCISAIYPDLIEIGIDAVNSQLFAMDMAELERTAKGRITFWGEIDRQHVLPSTDPAEVRAAVRRVAKHLYDPRGGIFAQFEFGPASQPENPRIIYEEWDRVQQEAASAAH
jgi:hypothetical protein